MDPTLIYAAFVRGLLASSVGPKFLNGITGHGFMKIMRADIAARYEITALPQVPEVLQYLVGRLGMPASEAYSTLNMGAGYVAVVGPGDVAETLRVARATGHDALVVGEVVKGGRALANPASVTLIGDVVLGAEVRLPWSSAIPRYLRYADRDAVIVAGGLDDAVELETCLSEHIRATGECGAFDDLISAVVALDAVDHS